MDDGENWELSLATGYVCFHSDVDFGLTTRLAPGDVCFNTPGARLRLLSADNEPGPRLLNHNSDGGVVRNGPPLGYV